MLLVLRVLDRADFNCSFPSTSLHFIRLKAVVVQDPVPKAPAAAPPSKGSRSGFSLKGAGTPVAAVATPQMRSAGSTIEVRLRPLIWFPALLRQCDNEPDD